MNPELDKLQPYPFQRFNSLIDGVEPNSDYSPVSWALGEPQHPAPAFLLELLQDETVLKEGVRTYPPTRGLLELREAIADFVTRRFLLQRPINPDTQVLPVTGTREALFSFAQAVLKPGGVTLMPNPFYQIYEGAALLGQSTPHYLNCAEAKSFAPDFNQVSDDVWQQCQLLYICSPGNPTGNVLDLEQLKHLIGLAHQHDFIIAADECYSEIYFDEAKPPPGILQAASELGDHEYKRCIAFNSLSKRSNLPGVRSGYVAGDADVLAKFLLYRTYHGSAMPVHHQRVSVAAWQDEDHVVANRAQYKSKFAAVTQVLNQVWQTPMPQAAFYLWPTTPIPDQAFAQRLYELINLKVVPGSFLARETGEGNPGENRVRIALVATEADCIEAAERIVKHWDQLSAS